MCLNEKEHRKNCQQHPGAYVVTFGPVYSHDLLYIKGKDKHNYMEPKIKSLSLHFRIILKHQEMHKYTSGCYNCTINLNFLNPFT